MAKFLSLSEQDHIKAIYHLQVDDTWVNTLDIAKLLGIASSSVSDMLKKLETKKVIKYQAYKGCTLNNLGNTYALQIIRKHRLWECFLVNKLKFSWDKVHEIAEQLEHIKSEELIDKLDSFLNFPTTDPHGDPIPNKNGKIKWTPQKCISELEIETFGTICRISDDNEDFLQLVDKLDLNIGKKIKIINQFKFDQSIEIKQNTKTTQIISKSIADKIFVQINN